MCLEKQYCLCKYLTYINWYSFWFCNSLCTLLNVCFFCSWFCFQIVLSCAPEGVFEINLTWLDLVYVQTPFVESVRPMTRQQYNKEKAGQLASGQINACVTFCLLTVLDTKYSTLRRKWVFVPLTCRYLQFVNGIVRVLGIFFHFFPNKPIINP